MKIHSIRIEHFACIRRAAIDLGPGLNVVFGPNDLGKSTLGRAIRAALLLPHTSSAAREFVPWDRDEQPIVHVTFETPERRYWRVEKRFGTTHGSSVLQESKDGGTFAVHKKAREVDDEVRTLLGWGIASPATKNAPKGLPTSFLATVLLGEQADVVGVLRQTLEADTDESGRARITSALEAFAQDPEFRRILDEAQRRVDEAFTPTGKRRGDRASPFRDATEEVKRIQLELDQVRRRVAESEAVRRTLEGCREQHDSRAAAREEAWTGLESLRTARARFEVRRALEADVAKAAGDLQRAQSELDTFADRLALHERNGARILELRLQKEALGRESQDRLARLESARLTLQRARSAEAERERELRLSDLDRRRMEIEANASTLAAGRDRITKALELSTRIEGAVRERDGLVEKVRQEEGREARARERVTELGRRLASVEVAGRLRALDGIRREIQELQAVGASASAERVEATALRERVTALESSRDQGLPGPPELETLRRLAQEIEVAEARLGGGLSIEIQRKRPLTIEVVVDGRKAEIPPKGKVRLEANRAARVRLGDDAVLTVTSGEREARDRAERLQERWAAEALPVLERTGARSLGELTERMAADAKTVSEIAGALRSASVLEDRARLREGQLTRLEGLRDDLRERERLLQGDGRQEADRLLAEIGAEGLDGHRTEVQQALAEEERTRDRASKAIGQATVERAILDERIVSGRSALAALGAPPPETWSSEEARLASALDRIQTQLDTVAGERDALVAGRNAEIRQAEEAALDAGRRLEETQEALRGVDSELATLQEEASRLAGEIDIRKENLRTVDRAALQERVGAARRALAGLPEPGREVGEEELRVARTALESADRECQRAQDELRKAEGALESSGGRVVIEAEDALREALQRAQEKEREIEVDYDAYRLLVEKLLEAENTEGRHVGDALSALVSERFDVLTAGRYAQVQIEQDLVTRGVSVDGTVRGVEGLSVGTQEQLATLLRLTVAEHLGSTLVLDDHLTQADPERSAWFRDLLREHASRAQVIVLTCRPLDYLRPEDMPEDGTGMAIRAGGLVRAIDASRALERTGSSSRARAGSNHPMGA